MLLETIRNFDWLNEPEFHLSTDAFQIIPDKKTDFWQDSAHGVSRDNGHFFFAKYSGDCSVSTKWKIETSQPQGAQCGLMGRIDEFNWCKIALGCNADQSWSITSVVTRKGSSDLALVPIAVISDQMTYRLESYRGDFCLSYSLNGTDFTRIRLFQIPNYTDTLSIGAYICNPGIEAFSAHLLEIKG